MDDVVLKLDNVTKYFGKVKALNSLSLSVKRGEIYGFLGPNGAGKTTTLRVCMGLLNFEEGEVYVDGERVSLKNHHFRKKVGYIPDRPYLYEKLTGFEFLKFIAMVRGLKNWEEKAYYYAKYFDIEDILNSLIESYSHGMKQKIVFISSILHEPKLLLIDEPMVGLDPRSAKKAKELFKKLKENGTAILLSTHSLDMAEEVSTRIGIIVKGRIIAEGEMEELKRRAQVEKGDLENVFLKLTEEINESF